MSWFLRCDVWTDVVARALSAPSTSRTAARGGHRVGGAEGGLGGRLAGLER